MIRDIPLNCVVFVCGDDDAVARTMAVFPVGESLYPKSVYDDLIGKEYRHSIDHLIYGEIEHRIVTSLRLGRRVIVHDDFDRRSRQQLIDTILSIGIPVYILVCSPFDNVSYRGAETIDVRKHQPRPVEPLPLANASEYLSGRYRGITALGDVHGSYTAFRTAIDWARQRDHYVFLAGDIVDYGPDGIETADEVYRLVTTGRATLITGNHERKIMRWSSGYRVRLSEGNRVTTLALMAMSESARTKWQGRFAGLYQNSRLVQRVGNLIFSHAAVHPSQWIGGEIDQTVENLAFFGEIDQQRSRPDRPVSSYRWTEQIPAFHCAVVGHAIRSRSFPLLETNRLGGQALFLDTGAGKGGILSSADFRFSEERWQLKNFNVY